MANRQNKAGAPTERDPETGDETPPPWRAAATSSRWSPIIAPVGIVLVACALWYWNRSRDEAVPPAAEPAHGVSTAEFPPSHLRMVAVLREIAERASADNPYFGDGPARELRGQLGALPAAGAEQRRVQTLMSLATEELKLGHEREAIEALSSARWIVSGASGRGLDKLLRSLSFRLGVAHLRLGETDNCCQQNTPESCILPIRGGGVHARPEGSRRAIEHFTEALRSTPPQSREYYQSVWLLNIAYMTLGQYPDDVPERYLIPPDAFRSAVSFPRFTNVAHDVGADTFSNLGGAVVDDLDGDGYFDILVSSWHASGQLHQLRNDGAGAFLNVTEESGLLGITGGCNLVQADYDNDGDVDVFVLRGGWFFQRGRYPNSLLQNNGDGSFVDVTFEAGLGRIRCRLRPLLGRTSTTTAT